MPKAYDLIDSIVDEMAPKGDASPTVLTIRGIIREALTRYQSACMEEAALRGEK